MYSTMIPLLTYHKLYPARQYRVKKRKGSRNPHTWEEEEEQEEAVFTRASIIKEDPPIDVEHDCDIDMENDDDSDVCKI